MSQTDLFRLKKINFSNELSCVDLLPQVNDAVSADILKVRPILICQIKVF